MEEAKAITEDVTTKMYKYGSNNNNNNDQGELAGANTGSGDPIKEIRQH
ncbi:3159_t:CDS:2 [Entrophospora sp. SA101]|nr:3159_t:CDS:2 [Entrophospora sp. SA101]